jgi:hypothetical protein
MGPSKFRIVSDLHFKNPQAKPSYGEFEVQPQYQALTLLEDIGNV